jgi:hypothetical protein
MRSPGGMKRARNSGTGKLRRDGLNGLDAVLGAHARALHEAGRLPERQRRREILRNRFQRRIERHWGCALNTLEELVATCCELGDRIVANHADSSSLFSAQALLWARGCQVGWEVLLLLRGGYADAAFARWRTLHEIAVVTAFLEKHGEAAAARYLDHVHIKNRKIVREYNACCADLGYPAIPAHEIVALDDKRAQVLKKYGNDFKEEYGWAAPFCGVAKPDFVALREAAGYAHWKAHFGMANHAVHAGPHGILFRLGHPVGAKPLALMGPSLLGLCDPLHASAIGLMHTTFAFVRAVRKEDKESVRDALGVTARLQYVLDLSRRAGDQGLKASLKLQKKYGPAGAHPVV